MTAAAFAALSVYGYTTKKDLSALGLVPDHGRDRHGARQVWSTCSCSLRACSFAISAIGVLVFAGLTAYDTQQIKDNYYAVGGDQTVLAKAAIMGALNLYLDFINMFTSLLQLMGDRE